MKTIGRWGYLIPVVWVVIGILYARTLESFADIGVAIMVVVSGIGLFGGVLTWRITRKWYWGLLGAVLTGLVVFGLVVLSVRI